MLTADQSSIIKRTVPALQTHGETLTRHMYGRMFERHPEVRGYFNPAHQREGSQQRALARAILAYACHIDEPAALTGLVELIAQKHVSLTIRPEHYDIVGENLLAAIEEVLGDAATPAVIDAWGAAYGVLADVFVRREAAIYDDQRVRHGWSGFKDFVLVRREPASDNIASFYLEPADGQPLTAHRAGRYVGIRTTLPDGRPVMRNYSLSNAPGTPFYRISVKRESAPQSDAPEGVLSNHLHERMRPGDRVSLTPPCGEFTLELPEGPSTPLVFIAGGVGVTPLLSMAHDALVRSVSTRPILFVQGALDGTARAFSDELQALERRHPNFRLHVRLSEPSERDRELARHHSEGLIDEKLIDELVGEGSPDYYFCGPTPMLKHVFGILKRRGVADARMRYEFFGPAGALEA